MSPRRPPRSGAFLLLALVLAGCQQHPLYQPRVAADEPGYESWQESATVYFVRFTGEPGMRAAQVRDLALLRAAELARAGGVAEFAVVSERAWTRPTFRRGNQAPPESPLASQPVIDYSRDQQEQRERSRSLIGDGPPVRIDIPFVELKLNAQVDATLRAQRPDAVYAVAELLRELPVKYGLPLPETR
ncbi:MAG: hypothetical protein KF715_00260 [Candidatus Didemnitutus sp.]|nr:hypothetical protein [Candidatus Didemnitutus sp.]